MGKLKEKKHGKGSTGKIVQIRGLLQREADACGMVAGLSDYPPEKVRLLEAKQDAFVKAIAIVDGIMKG